MLGLTLLKEERKVLRLSWPRGPKVWIKENRTGIPTREKVVT